jgi:hypothetical protein
MTFSRLLRRIPCLFGLHSWSFNGARLINPHEVPRRTQIHWICIRCRATREEITTWPPVQ